MVWLCIYLWVCAFVASLVAITTVRPAHAGDYVRAALLPILLPFFFIVHLTRKL